MEVVNGDDDEATDGVGVDDDATDIVSFVEDDGGEDEDSTNDNGDYEYRDGGFDDDVDDDDVNDGVHSGDDDDAGDDDKLDDEEVSMGYSPLYCTFLLAWKGLNNTGESSTTWAEGRARTAAEFAAEQKQASATQHSEWGVKRDAVHSLYYSSEYAEIPSHIRFFHLRGVVFDALLQVLFHSLRPCRIA